MPLLSMNKWIVYLVVAFVLITLLVFLVIRGSRRTEGPETALEKVQTTELQVYYNFTLQNMTSGLLEKAKLWTYAPVRETSTQRCLKIEASHPYQLIADDMGNQILLFEIPDLSPYATKIISIRVDLVLSALPSPIDLKEEGRFLGPEKFIESSDPEIAGLARKSASADPLKTAENLFQWVAENIQNSGYTSEDRGALYALRNRKGDCTEYMFIFVALCRASGIPARGVGGYLCEGNCILKPNNYHNWAEFRQGDVWYTADPQRKLFKQQSPYYIAMEIVGESAGNPMQGSHRFRYTGDGLKVTMNN